MKLLEKRDFEVVLKTVDYFGIPLTIYDEIMWLATDENGRIYGYTVKPALSDNVWLAKNLASDWFYIGNVDLEDLDWKDTLLKINNLTKG